MNRFLCLFTAASLFMGACSNDDPVPAAPDDADENTITSVVLTVSGQSYTAEIAEHTITMTVPYTVSLDQAQAQFEIAASASILPDPAAITDWDNERTFRVTSYRGAANEYTYKVVKDEIRHEGDVELKTTADVTAFAAKDVTVVKGNLTIGSDDVNAEPITDLSPLSILKEVTGTIRICNSFHGADLTGLDHISSVGGLQIGSADAFAANPELHMLSMKSLERVTGDLLVRDNQIVFVQFDRLTEVGGKVAVSSSALQSFEFPELARVGADFDVQGLTDEGKAGGEIAALEIPALTTVGGRLGVNNLGKLISIGFPRLKEAGSIEFASVPVPLETLSLPELAVVNGDLCFISNQVFGDFASSTANNKLLEIDGLTNLTTVKGTLTLSRFQVLQKLPDLSKLTRLGGLKLNRLLEYYGQVLDLGKVDFEAFGDNVPTIEITGNTILSKLITKEDLSHVNVILYTVGGTGNPGPTITPELNFRFVHDFTDNNAAKEDPVYTFEKVYGNLDITRINKNGLSMPNLTSVGGYMHILIRMMASNLDFPSLEQVGGQMYLEGNLNAPLNFKYDFSSLKSVCCTENPPYYKKEGSPSANMLPYGSLDLSPLNKDFAFPALERVGGQGLTVRRAKSFSCPNLQAVDGILCAENATQTAFDMPRLTRLSGVTFNRMSNFIDYTLFGPFIKDGQIKEQNWKITGCGYNPTYEDMVNGNYVKK